MLVNSVNKINSIRFILVLSLTYFLLLLDPLLDLLLLPLLGRDERDDPLLTLPLLERERLDPDEILPVDRDEEERLGLETRLEDLFEGEEDCFTDLPSDFERLLLTLEGVEVERLSEELFERDMFDLTERVASELFILIGMGVL
jgi:hypothetical protein